MQRIQRITLLCLGLLIGAVAASAAEFPTGPIRLVVGFPPGGGTDGAARIVAEKLGPELGQTIIVDNRAGAGGTIGALSVARSAPDGHTLFFGTGAELMINPITRKTAPYDVLKDFVPITEAGGVSFVLVVPAASPIDSVQTLVSHAGAQPGRLQFSSFGVGSTNHLIAELFLSSTGVKATHIPYKGSQPALMALLGGEVGFAFETAAVALPQIKAGKLKALATPSPQRLRDLPDVPTLQELGHKQLVAEGWMGVFAPAGTPADVVGRLNQALVKVLRTADVHDKLTDRGVKVVASSPEEYRRKLGLERDKWQQVVKDAGVALTE
ncbi:MAG: tripartite tricarboxylate transporter substrate binding protein [Burkholderiaceae bacterium]|nr:tripartite tricarboxylate transporter substrate binding protein [Burkholderiaceae bacterium]